jgi:hypothetical protein
MPRSLLELHAGRCGLSLLFNKIGVKLSFRLWRGKYFICWFSKGLWQWFIYCRNSILDIVLCMGYIWCKHKCLYHGNQSVEDGGRADCRNMAYTNCIPNNRPCLTYFHIIVFVVFRSWNCTLAFNYTNGESFFHQVSTERVRMIDTEVSFSCTRWKEHMQSRIVTFDLLPKS